MDQTSVLIIALGAFLIGLAYYCYIISKKLQAERSKVVDLMNKYSGIVNIDAEINQRAIQITTLEKSINDLRADYSLKRGIFESLLNATEIYESKLEDISFGIYEPVYKYETSDQYKVKLESIRASVKQLIKDDKAAFCVHEWTVSGSKVEGRKMMKQYSKLLLRAFNGECDSVIARVTWNNIGTMLVRITKSYEAINKLGVVNQISITKEYYDLKVAELNLEYELQEKLQAEKEEQRMIRDQMREEEKAQREIEQAQRKAEDEEARYQKALAKATEDAKRASGEQLAELDLKITELQALLTAAQFQKERALSMAQQTKSGHVYVISNIGSFGEDVFKIGMTRRLDPMDRVKELGDASVPFSFDVHALIYSDNAPDLEYKIHRQLADRRVNLINNRREFFRIDMTEVESVFSLAGHSLSLTKLAEAKEYRETLSIRESKNRIALSENIPSSNAMPLTLD